MHFKPHVFLVFFLKFVKIELKNNALRAHLVEIVHFWYRNNRLSMNHSYLCEYASFIQDIFYAYKYLEVIFCPCR
jgi:hypothetical protein